MDAGSASAPRYSGAGLVAMCRGASFIQRMPTYEFRCRTLRELVHRVPPDEGVLDAGHLPRSHDDTLRFLGVAGVMRSGSATAVSTPAASSPGAQPGRARRHERVDRSGEEGSAKR